MNTRDKLHKLIGFVPAERMNHKDLPKDHIVRYQKEAEEANERVLDLLAKLTDRVDALQNELAHVATRTHEIVVNVPESAPPQVVCNVPQQPAPTVTVNPQITVSPAENPAPVVNVPERKATKKVGRMTKEDGVWKVTIEEEG